MKRSNVPRWAWGSVFLTIAVLSPAILLAQERVVVSKALDHCTILVGKNEKVSLIGVGRPPTNAFTIKDAREHLEDMLRGREVVLVADPAIPETPGVRFRYVYLDGDLINERVISEGFAGVNRDQTCTKADALVQAEKMARRMKIGAWVLDAQISDEQFMISISPNPVTQVAMMQYQIPELCNVTLLVIDSTQRVVASLVNARMQPGGYTAMFQRLRLPNGRYRVQLSAGSRVVSEQMTLTGRLANEPNGDDEPSPGVTVGDARTSQPPERKSFRLPGGGITESK